MHVLDGYNLYFIFICVVLELWVYNFRLKIKKLLTVLWNTGRFWRVGALSHTHTVFPKRPTFGTFWGHRVGVWFNPPALQNRPVFQQRGRLCRLTSALRWPQWRSHFEDSNNDRYTHSKWSVYCPNCHLRQIWSTDWHECHPNCCQLPVFTAKIINTSTFGSISAFYQCSFKMIFVVLCVCVIYYFQAVL